MIHLVSEVEALEAEGLAFVFTDGHAVMEFSAFYEVLYALGFVIDWDIMKETYWADTPEDGDRKRRRQAEFLVDQFCPGQLITEIGVINTTIQAQVQRILQNVNYQPPVTVYL